MSAQRRLLPHIQARFHERIPADMVEGASQVVFTKANLHSGQMDASFSRVVSRYLAAPQTGMTSVKRQRLRCGQLPGACITLAPI